MQDGGLDAETERRPPPGDAAAAPSAELAASVFLLPVNGGKTTGRREGASTGSPAGGPCPAPAQPAAATHPLPSRARAGPERMHPGTVSASKPGRRTDR